MADPTNPPPRSLLHRLLHVGVHDGLPPTEAKYVILNNTLVVVMSLVACLVVPNAYAMARGSSHADWMLLLLLQVPIYMFSFVFAAQRMHYTATLWFGGMASVSLVVQAHLLGRESCMHFFLLLHAVGPFVLVPPRYRRWVFVQTALYFAVFAYTLVAVSDVPMLPMPPGTMNSVGKINLVFVFFSLVAFGYYERTNTLHAEKMVEEERQRAETLLLNILPGDIAERLKRDQSSIADGFASVTVLFADIAGFTPLAGKLTPPQLVAMLNEVFSAFDAMVERHGLEKIKTIGDAYMAAAGLPRPRPDHAAAVADMALEMVATIAKLKTPDGTQLAMRIGVNSGPVVAGVIGKKKFIYDLWGDTVNTAARMESHGEPGQVQVTQSTYELLRDDFELEHRGNVYVKGKGDMPTYWLRSRKGKPAPA